MPRRYDDEDDDRPARNRRRRDDELDDDRPARSRRQRDDDDYDRPRRTKKKNKLPLILGIVGGVLVLLCAGGGFALYHFTSKVRSQVAERQETTNNMTKIGRAMHNYHDQFGTLPHNTYDGKDGKPLLSWRVHLLPRFEQHALYSQFRLDEPWDGPNNRQLLSQMPRIYATSDMRLEDGKTYYRAFSHRGAVFEHPTQPPYRQQIRFAQMSDGLVNTILLVEAGEPTEWTKPDDLDWSPGRPMPPLGRGPGDRVVVLMADGSVRALKKSMAESTWRGLITYGGNEVVNPD
jgi:Protein of unknown function (DUF1559)